MVLLRVGRPEEEREERDRCPPACPLVRLSGERERGREGKRECGRSVLACVPPLSSSFRRAVGSGDRPSDTSVRPTAAFSTDVAAAATASSWAAAEEEEEEEEGSFEEEEEEARGAPTIQRHPRGRRREGGRECFWFSEASVGRSGGGRRWREKGEEDPSLSRTN